MGSNYIQMDNFLAKVQEDAVIIGTLHKKNGSFEELLKFEIVPLNVRTPFEIYMKYKINRLPFWTTLSKIGPHDSLSCLTKIAEERFDCHISEEVCDAIEALRLARKLLY